MDISSVIKAVKEQLKHSGITYRDLAKALGMSEAGIKKVLSKDDLSLKRLLSICEVLKISFGDLVDESEALSQKVSRFTDEQIEFFVEILSYFNFYMQTAYEQKTVQQIQVESKISARSVNKYLKKLEALSLIERLPGDRVVPIGGVPITISTKGTKLEGLKNKIVANLARQIESSGQGQTMGGSYLLTESESAKLKSDLEQLLVSYSLQSNKNRRLRKSDPDKYKPDTVMISATPLSIFTPIIDL